MSAFQNLQKAASLRLSDDLVTALEQADIMQQPNGLDWLKHNPRLVEALNYVAGTYAHRTRKFGNRLSLTHPLWVGYRSFHARVVHQHGECPVATAFIAICHDAIEEARKQVWRPQTQDIATVIITDLSSIWADRKTFPSIQSDIHYLTDDNNINKKDQLQAQIDKSFNKRGACIVGTRGQVVRINDKTEHGVGDVKAHKAGLLPDSHVVPQLGKVCSRRFVTRMPCAKANNNELRACSRSFNGKLIQGILTNGGIHEAPIPERR